MHFSTIACALAAFPVFSVAVPWQPWQGNNGPSQSPPSIPGSPSSPTGTSPSSTCWTFRASYVPKSSVWTSWYTSATSCTSTITSTVTKTTTPSASVTTITSSTTVTGTTSTLTQTDTSTTTETDTETDTATSTTTVTTTSTSTSTVPTSAGFTPVQSSLPGSSYSGSGGSDPESKKRSIGKKRSLGLDLPLLGSSNSQDTSKASYVQGVKCQKWVGECDTTTITTTVTASTPISSTTTTITSIINPSATTTVTSTETDTTTTTTTTTNIGTSTSTIPTSTTVYAACASSNLIDTYLAVPIVNLQGGSGDQMGMGFIVNSAYDCCVSAFTVPDSSPEAFEYTAAIPSQPCYVIFPGTGDTCSAGQDSYTFEANASPEAAGEAATVGNGYCGIINQGDVLTS